MAGKTSVRNVSYDATTAVRSLNRFGDSRCPIETQGSTSENVSHSRVNWLTRYATKFKSCCLLSLVTALVIMTGSSIASGQEPTRKQIATAKKELQRAGQLFRAQRYDDAGKVVSDLYLKIKPWKIPKEPALSEAYTELRRSLQKARKALGGKGVELQGTGPTRRRSQRRPPIVEAPDSTATTTVSFAKQLAPILVEKCLSCHGPDDRSANFSVATFRRLARGGNQGPVFDNGPAAKSLLIGKLKGTADGDQMPVGDDPLTDEQIALFARWIDQGAPNDAGSDRVELSEVANELKLAQASDAELSQERRSKASENWKLAFPATTPNVVETDHYLLMGTAAESSLAEIGATAETTRERIAATLKTGKESLDSKGRVTIFVVNRAFDLSEFAVMVEGRNLPRPVPDAFWSVAGADAYVVARITAETTTENHPLPRALAGVMLQARGGYPAWFVSGVADSIAVKLSPRHPQALEATSSRGLLSSLTKPRDFLEGRTSVDVADAASYRFVTFLRSSDRRFAQVLERVDRSSKFDAAVQEIYGRPVKDLVNDWWMRAKQGRGR